MKEVEGEIKQQYSQHKGAKVIWSGCKIVDHSIISNDDKSYSNVW